MKLVDGVGALDAALVGATDDAFDPDLALAVVAKRMLEHTGFDVVAGLGAAQLVGRHEQPAVQVLHVGLHEIVVALGDDLAGEALEAGIKQLVDEGDVFAFFILADLDANAVAGEDLVHLVARHQQLLAVVEHDEAVAPLRTANDAFENRFAFDDLLFELAQLRKSGFIEHDVGYSL